MCKVKALSKVTLSFLLGLGVLLVVLGFCWNILTHSQSYKDWKSQTSPHQKTTSKEKWKPVQDTSNALHTYYSDEYGHEADNVNLNPKGK